jgi:hypothetical protein
MCECLVDNVPEVSSKLFSFIYLILNIIVSGLGTYMVAIKENPSNSEQLKKSALFQFLSSFVVFGWFWSVYWGITLVQKCPEGGSTVVHKSEGYGEVKSNDNEKGDANLAK